MKMIEFFIARKIVVHGAGHSISKAPCAASVQDYEFDDIIDGGIVHPAIKNDSGAII